MERVLRIYQRPVDPRFPVVCFDEAGTVLREHTREPLVMTSGHLQREDAEEVRRGYADLFLWVAPFLGQRQIFVTQRRTKQEFALALRDLVHCFPAAERITLILDNLNTHIPGALFEAFPPEEAAAIDAKLEWVFTPIHGSWLNLAEVEWSVLRRRCLHRRIGDEATLRAEIAAWVADRNAEGVQYRWSFTPEDARRALPHAYPVVHTPGIPDDATLPHQTSPR
jgi:DDE superfamily endonuclease